MNRTVIALVLPLAACAGDKVVAPDCHDRPAAALFGPVPEVRDDGYSTYVTFPGRMRIPAVTAIGQDGKERAVERTFDPQSGEMLVHGVFPTIVFRDGARVACAVNPAYDPVGRRP